jgi:hypothetical protein
MTEPEYKVPRLLWESLEAVLLAQGKRLVKDMAKTLDVNEKELLKKVFPTKDSIKVTLHDTQTSSLQCQAYVQDGAIVKHCGHPVLLGSEFCGVHRTNRSTVTDTGSATQYIKLRDSPDRPSLWVRLRDNYVVDCTGKIRGQYSRERESLQLFQIEEL